MCTGSKNTRLKVCKVCAAKWVYRKTGIWGVLKLCWKYWNLKGFGLDLKWGYDGLCIDLEVDRWV